MNPISNYDSLKSKQRAIRNNFPETMGLRVHRAISWIGRAEVCRDDHDARFIFLWIAFNAVYADEQEFQTIPTGERSAFTDYFYRLVEHDKDLRIYNALWQRFSGPVKMLMDNHYVFNPFWQHYNGIYGFEDWKEKLKLSLRNFSHAFRDRDCARVLKFVFERLYVLRNQLVHGGSTWNSRINRNQVRDGARILTFLMPIFIDLMMDNPQEDWGKPFYPVVK